LPCPTERGGIGSYHSLEGRTRRRAVKHSSEGSIAIRASRYRTTGPAIVPRNRPGFRALVFAVFAALFGFAPIAHAQDSDRGNDRGNEREIERGNERGNERGEYLRRQQRSTGRDVDSDDDKDSKKGKGE
jgi:hypothetical protein